jgi:hypothetical protein
VTDTIRTKFFMIIYSQRILKTDGEIVVIELFQKAGANIGNILTANKLFCTIPEKKCKTVFAFFIVISDFQKADAKIRGYAYSFQMI